MLNKDGFYTDGRTAYIIGKMTEKTVLFVPVKSERVGYGDVSSAFLFDTLHKATKEVDEDRESIRFRLKNNYSTRGLAIFYEGDKEMFELDSDTFTIEHNYG